MKKAVFKCASTILLLLSSSCTLRGGIKDRMYFCRNYKYIKLMVLENGVEKDSAEYSSLIKEDPNYTYIHFVKDGSFIQRTYGKYVESSSEHDYDLIERGYYYQEDFSIYLDYDDGKKLIAYDRPDGISDVTRIKIPFKLPVSESETIDTFIYYYNGIYNSHCWIKVL